MRLLIISGYGARLSASRNSLVLTLGDKKEKIPIAEVDAVLVASSGVSVTSKAMRLMLVSGVEMVVLNGRGDPVGILYASHYTRTPETRRAQYLAHAEGRGAEYARAFARCKILSQASAIRRLYTDLGMEGARRVSKEIAGFAGDLEVMSPRDPQDIMGIEAIAARAYWGAIAALLPQDLGFDIRDQDGSDPVNVSLNYGYGILYALSWRALVLAGLDPYAGFLHVDRSGKPVLAFDYAEMWRAPLVDEAIVRLIARGWRPEVSAGRLGRKSRLEIAEAISKRLKDSCPGAPRSESFESAIKSYALGLASALRKRIPYSCYDGGWD